MGGGRGGERELAEMTGSLEQLAGLEEKEEEEDEEESGSFGSWLRDLFARVAISRYSIVHPRCESF